MCWRDFHNFLLTACVLNHDLFPDLLRFSFLVTSWLYLNFYFSFICLYFWEIVSWFCGLSFLVECIGFSIYLRIIFLIKDREYSFYLWHYDIRAEFASDFFPVAKTVMIGASRVVWTKLRFSSCCRRKQG